MFSELASSDAIEVETRERRGQVDEPIGVRLENITRRYGETVVLPDFSLDVRQGEFLTLVGPSGCGKSTLLRIIAGLEAPSSGSVSIEGRRIDRMRPKDRDVAMVFQNYALYPHMSVAQNIALPLHMRRLTSRQRLPMMTFLSQHVRRIRTEIEADAAEAARLLNITHLLERKPGQLSGGQRQRVAVGRAIVRHPKVFLMDEPLSNLDAKLRVHMRSELAQLHRRLGVTWIYVTHDQTEAMTMSHRIAVMVDGELLQVDTPSSVYDDPTHLKVAQFIATPQINLVPASVRTDGGIDILGKVLAKLPGVATGSSVMVGLRPEALKLAGPGGHNTVPSRVVHFERSGVDAYVHAVHEACASPLIVKVEVADLETLSLDQTVRLKLDPKALLCFRQDGQRIRHLQWVAA